ncbi:MAG: hypothetical protein R3F34_16720 [Planctomycetota bacterium]
MNIGIHVGILEEVGCRGLEVRLEDGSGRRALLYADGNFAMPPDDANLLRWHITWASFERRAPLRGLDEILLRDHAMSEIDEVLGAASR